MGALKDVHSMVIWFDVLFIKRTCLLHMLKEYIGFIFKLASMYPFTNGFITHQISLEIGHFENFKFEKKKSLETQIISL